MMAKDSYNLFCGMWARHNQNNDDIPSYRIVINKLLTHIGDNISSIVSCDRLGLIIFLSHMTEREAISMTKKSMTDFDQVDVFLTEAAQVLRGILLEVKSQAEPLPLVLMAEHFWMGQAPTPDRCVKFMQIVICQDSSNPIDGKQVFHSLSVMTC